MIIWLYSVPVITRRAVCQISTTAGDQIGMVITEIVTITEVYEAVIQDDGRIMTLIFSQFVCVCEGGGSFMLGVVLLTFSCYLGFDYKQIQRCNTFVLKDAKSTGCKLYSYYTQYHIPLNDVQLFVYTVFIFMFFPCCIVICVLSYVCYFITIFFSSFYTCFFPLISHTEMSGTLFV